MRKFVLVAALALFVLHQDFWNWDNRDLWFGFLPAGLGYHTLYSILAAALWALAAFFAWPDEIESFGETGELVIDKGGEEK